MGALIFLIVFHAIGFFMFGWQFWPAYLAIVFFGLLSATLGWFFAILILIRQVYSFFVDGYWLPISGMDLLNFSNEHGGVNFYHYLSNLPGLIRILEWLSASIFLIILMIPGVLVLSFHNSFIMTGLKELFLGKSK